jgi:Ca-activated chloride channel family protein
LLALYLAAFLTACSADIPRREHQVKTEGKGSRVRVDGPAMPEAPVAPPPPSVYPQGAIEMDTRQNAMATVYGGASGAMALRKATYQPKQDEAFNTEEYGRISENPFLLVSEQPRSTFSADVDRASYSNVRRFLTAGQLPPRDAVRIEELINYFPYHYGDPAGDAPFGVTTDVVECPWKAGNRLVRIGLQTRHVALENLPPNNIVFLIDVSGSMESPDKLPLLKSAIGLLVDQLRPQDRVAIVVYAGSAGVVLPSTSGANKGEILGVLDKLEAGGSTAGGEGIVLAYKLAKENFLRGGNNRVVLASDGDFNVGVSSDGELEQLIEQKRRDGIFLTVLGFGTGNVKDSKMELLADKGNGNYAYIDTLQEARKTLVEELGGTLLTVAKDVKLQVEFNPATVAAYRLIGYENRMLRTQDFRDDTKDAGEVGAGHTVTALYELIPPGGDLSSINIDPLKYQRVTSTEAAGSGELMTLRIRYKAPDGDVSRESVFEVADAKRAISASPQDFRFAAAVAEFGMLLRDSKAKGTATWDSALQLASTSQGEDAQGYRQEFISMIRQAQQLSETQRGTN